MLKTERAIINMGEPDAGCMSQEERVYFFDAIFRGYLPYITERAKPRPGLRHL